MCVFVCVRERERAKKTKKRKEKKKRNQKSYHFSFDRFHTPGRMRSSRPVAVAVLGWLVESQVK